MRLLIAEDEASLSKAIVTILRKNKYTVDAAFDGVEALEYLVIGKGYGFHLVVCISFVQCSFYGCPYEFPADGVFSCHVLHYFSQSFVLFFAV